MSTLWTPSGERPVGNPQTGPAEQPPAPAQPAAPSPSGRDRRPRGDDDVSEEQLAAEMAEVQRQLAETPASVIVVNHCVGLFQLAVLHLEQEPPRLEDAQLAIDGLAGVIDALGPRLGDDEQPLRDALAQLRLGFVQRKTAGQG